MNVAIESLSLFCVFFLYISFVSQSKTGNNFVMLLLSIVVAIVVVVVVILSLVVIK